MILFFKKFWRYKIFRYIYFSLWIYYFSIAMKKRLTEPTELSDENQFLAGYNWGLMHGVSHKGSSNLTQTMLFELYAIIYKLILVHDRIDPRLLVTHSVLAVYVMLVIIKTNSLNRSFFVKLYNSRETLKKFKDFVADHLPSSLLILSKNQNKVLFKNKSFQQQFDITEEDDSESILNKLGQIRIDPNSERTQSTSVSGTLSVHITDFGYFLRIQLKNIAKPVSLNCSHETDSQKKTFEVKILPMFWDGEESLALLFHDISHQEALLSLKIRTENQEKAIAIVAHELRNPVNGLLGLTRIMENNIRNPRSLKKSLNILKTNINLLLSILNSILDNQQLRANKLTLNISDIDLSQLITNVALLYEFQLKSKNLEFKSYIDDSLPRSILSDKGRLNQILINLVANALKFTSVGGITVSVLADPDDKSRVIFKVSDTGIGIKPEDRDKLFQMFGKLQSSMEINQEGVGLGLMISNSLVKVLNRNEEGHQIMIENDSKVGTTFYFSIYADYHKGKNGNIEAMKGGLIPLVDLDETRIDEHITSNHETQLTESRKCLSLRSSFKESKSRHHAKETPQLFFASQPSPAIERQYLLSSNSNRTRSTKSLFSKKAVIIADDSSFNLFVLKDMLTSFGYKCYGVNNGKEVVDKVQELHKRLVHIDFILMDYEMPIMDGLEATKILREQRIDIPIIGLSGNSGKEFEEMCLKGGMNKVMQKPLKEEDINSILSFINSDI